MFATVVVVGLGLILFEFATDVHGGVPLSVMGAHQVLSGLSRSHTQLVALMFICIAVAVPVTASQYTPKLLRVFLADRMHVAVLSTYSMAAVHAHWVQFMSREGLVSMTLITAIIITNTIAFIMVVPYFFYVIEFLEPQSLVTRIRAQATRALLRAHRSPRSQERAKSDLAHALHDLGSLVLKSVGGTGRESAALGIVAIREMLQEYGADKGALPRTWFEATKAEFRGLSREALQFTTAERCWVEVAALRDLGRAFDAAVTGMPDAVVLIADTVRGIGEDANVRDDIPVLDNAVRAMNSMLRSAINARNPRAIFDVLLQYEALAEVCLDRRCDLAGDIAAYYGHYGQRARRVGMEFIPELFVYDLGTLLRTAAERKSLAKDRIVDGVLVLVANLSTAPTVPLACALMVIQGSTRYDLPIEDLDRLLTALLKLPESVIEQAMAILDATVSPRYHELSSRQVDVNFLPPQDLEYVQQRIASHHVAA